LKLYSGFTDGQVGRCIEWQVTGKTQQ